MTIGHGRSKVGKWKFHNSYHPILHTVSECRTLQPGPKLTMTCFTLYRNVSEIDAGCESLNKSWQVSLGAPWVCLPHISAPAWNQELFTMTQVFRRGKWTCDVQSPLELSRLTMLCVEIELGQHLTLKVFDVGSISAQPMDVRLGEHKLSRKIFQWNFSKLSSKIKNYYPIEAWVFSSGKRNFKMKLERWNKFS